MLAWLQLYKPMVSSTYTKFLLLPTDTLKDARMPGCQVASINTIVSGSDPALQHDGQHVQAWTFDARLECACSTSHA